MVVRRLLESLFFICAVMLFSCGEDEITKEPLLEDSVSDSVNLSEELDIDNGQAKIFTMPTPVQTASALQLMGVKYNEELLLPHKFVKSHSDIDLSLALGMYMVDMGYATVYNNPQSALHYAKDAQSIMEELPIAYYVNDAFAKRFKANQGNRDSLIRIILQGYNDANQYITQSENEGVGLLILAGAYIEGFYLLVSSQPKGNWEDEYNSALIQQKQFMDNFLTLLNPYRRDDKVGEVYGLLEELNTAFEGIEIAYNEEKQVYELPKPLSFKQRQLIKKKAIKLREDLKTRMK